MISFCNRNKCLKRVLTNSFSGVYLLSELFSLFECCRKLFFNIRIIIKHFHKRFYIILIDLLPFTVYQLSVFLTYLHYCTLYSIYDQRIESICIRYYSINKWSILSFNAIRITLTVYSFMVTFHNRDDILKHRNCRKYTGAF